MFIGIQVSISNAEGSYGWGTVTQDPCPKLRQETQCTQCPVGCKKTAQQKTRESSEERVRKRKVRHVCRNGLAGEGGGMVISRELSGCRGVSNQWRNNRPLAKWMNSLRRRGRSRVGSRERSRGKSRSRNRAQRQPTRLSLGLSNKPTGQGTKLGDPSREET